MPEGPNGGAALPFMAGGPAGCPELSPPSRPEGPGLGPGCPLGSKPARLRSTVRIPSTRRGKLYAKPSMVHMLKDGGVSLGDQW